MRVPLMETVNRFHYRAIYISRELIYSVVLLGCQMDFRHGQEAWPLISVNALFVSYNFLVIEFVRPVYIYNGN